MEYISGKTLKEYIKDNYITEGILNWYNVYSDAKMIVNHCG